MRKTPGVKVNATEQDALSRYWRGRLFWQRGELRKIKRSVVKRERQATKRALREESPSGRRGGWLG